MLENTLESPLNSKVINSMNLAYTLEGLILKLQSFGHLMQRANSMEKFQMLGEIEVKRIRGLQRFAGIFDMSLRKLWEIVKDREAQCVAVHGGHKKLEMTKQMNNTLGLL